MPVTLIEKGGKHLKEVGEAMELLIGTKVLAGVPSDKVDRRSEEGEDQGPINNATLMYIHEHGAPEVNIPARPVLHPAMKSIQDKVTRMLKNAADLALKGDKAGVMKQYHAIGILAQNAMRERITKGPFVLLKPSTLAARRARGRTGTKPLIDTGQLRRSLAYVIRTGEGGWTRLWRKDGLDGTDKQKTIKPRGGKPKKK